MLTQRIFWFGSNNVTFFLYDVIGISVIFAEQKYSGTGIEIGIPVIYRAKTYQQLYMSAVSHGVLRLRILGNRLRSSRLALLSDMSRSGMVASGGHASARTLQASAVGPRLDIDVQSSVLKTSQVVRTAADHERKKR